MRRAVVLWLLVACACSARPPDEGFVDHTQVGLRSKDDYAALAATANGRSEVKFIITRFDAAGAQALYMDSAFYALHDEWYWFRLLNGHEVPGLSTAPVSGHTFDSISAVYAWAKVTTPLPLDLRWVDDDRLYSPRFYTLALDLRPRGFGVGTLLHVAARATRPERWAFQLEFTDAPTAVEIASFFTQLRASLPPDIADALHWVVRSTRQEAVAQAMERQQLPWHDRILRPEDLTAPGEIEVYNEGLTAGRLRFFPRGTPIEGTSDTDIVVLADVPDVLPPAAGVVTATPQTPLAHLNLLARNRGIPNGYQADVLDDATLLALAAGHTPVVVKMQAPNELVLKPISEATFAQWLQLRGKAPVAVRAVDVSTLPLSHDLRSLTLADSETLRPSIGGKATGYLALIDATPSAIPDAMEAITIRPYVEHLAPFRARLEAMLAAPEFVDDVRTRFLVLEGEADFRQAHSDAAAFITSFFQRHGPGDVLHDFVRSGGVKRALRDAPLAPTTLAAITTSLRTRFAHYAVTQGLRFRSSSTAEDVEGFNGAGLYDSNTGFLDAAAQAKPKDREQTVEWALKKTWASYWSAPAFEERALENVDHLSGNMGVVVHARFDDDRERNNGVFLLTLQGDAATMELNVQHGATSVTNPTSTALPEVLTVTQSTRQAPLVISRLRASTLVAAGTQLLSDDEVAETFSRGRAVAERWLAHENSLLPETHRSRALVLDFEFRSVAAGWPALITGSLPSRIVLKQARSIDPGLRAVSPNVLALPIPRDVLSRARRVERRTCTNATLTATLVEVFTNPLARPDVGFSVMPFTASLRLDFLQAIPALNLSAGDVIDVAHTSLSDVKHPSLPAAWSFESTVNSASLTRVELSAPQVQLGGAQTFEGAGVTCQVDVLSASATDFLVHLLESP